MVGGRTRALEAGQSLGSGDREGRAPGPGKWKTKFRFHRADSHTKRESREMPAGNKPATYLFKNSSVRSSATGLAPAFQGNYSNGTAPMLDVCNRAH